MAIELDHIEIKKTLWVRQKSILVPPHLTPKNPAKIKKLSTICHNPIPWGDTLWTISDW